MSATFSGLVDAGITATNGRPSIRAKYASLTAVDPLDASTTVLPSVICPARRPPPRPRPGRPRRGRPGRTGRRRRRRTPGSAPLEGGFSGAVLEEGAHPGLLVLGVEQAREELGLQGEAPVQRHVEPLVD